MSHTIQHTETSGGRRYALRCAVPNGTEMCSRYFGLSKKIPECDLGTWEDAMRQQLESDGYQQGDITYPPTQCYWAHLAAGETTRGDCPASMIVNAFKW